MENFTATIGSWTIDKLLETETTTTAGFLFPDWGDQPHPDPFVMGIHTWVLRSGRRTILIDTGAGNGKRRPHTPFLDDLDTPYLARLAALGIEPEAVEMVLFTHLHVDHVGWNTQFRDGAWHPTFPNARHLCTARELDFYKETPGIDPADNNLLAYVDSVLPVRQAGLFDTVEPDGHEVLPGLSFLSAPGHSADHSVIRLAAGGEVALFIGDLMHNPLQVERPELSSVFCLDRDQARLSREHYIEFAAEQDALILAAHFPGRSAGRVHCNGGGYAWKQA